MSLRILFLAEHVPASPRAPGSPRLYDLMRGLHARGHSLALVCGASDRARWHEFLTDDGAGDFLDAAFPVFDEPRLAQPGRIRNLFSARPPFDFQWRANAFFENMRNALTRALSEFPCDVLHVDRLLMAQFIPDSWRGALVVDPHDAISLTETRKLSLAASHALSHALMRYQISKIKRYEAAMAARADAYVVNAQPDCDYLAAFLPGAKLHAIPNGVDTDFYHPAPDIVPGSQIVFTGSFTYAFNTDAMLYFHANVLSQIRRTFPALRLVIVGANPPPVLLELAARDALTAVTGFVQDIRPFVWESAAFISPLRGGTGMKNKLLNAMAMGKPIVATPTSADGLGITDGQEMLLAESDAAFANAVGRVLDEPALAKRLGDAGRAFVEREYGYPKLAARFEELYLGIIRKKPSASLTNL